MILDHPILYVILGFVLPAFALLHGTTCYMHRDRTHGALYLRAPLRWLARILIFVQTAMKPWQWKMVHARHHEESDEPGDPHSPWQHRFYWFFGRRESVKVGSLKVLLFTAVYYRRALKDPVLWEKYYPQVEHMRDRWDRLIFDRGFLFGPVLCLGSLHFLTVQLAGAPLTMVLATWLTSIAVYMFGGGLVNMMHGRSELSSAGDHSTNGPRILNWVLGYVIFGEIFQEYHHKYANSARLHWKWWRDPGYCYSVAWSWFRLVRINKLTLGPTSRRNAALEAA